MPKPTQANRFLHIQSVLGEDALIISRADGQESLGRLYEIRVEFTAERDDLDLDALLGTPVVLRLDMAGQKSRATTANSRHFHGFFSRITYAGFQQEGRPNYRATIVPWLWFLTRTSDCRIFQNKSVTEIIKQVFSDSGFSDYKFNLKKTYQPVEYCVQYRETDFNFVSRLMEREGIYYHFVHEQSGYKMVMCDDMGCESHQPEKNFATLSFIGGSSTQDKEGVITDWQFSREVKSGAFAHNDFNFLTPSPDPNLRLVSRSTAPKVQKPQAFEIYDAPGGFLNQGEGSRYARIRMEELLADRDVAEASTDIQGICAGRKFKLEKHPTKKQNRGYLITSVHWSAHEGAYGSGGGGGGSFFNCGFTCIPDDGVFRSARVSPHPKIDGPQTAIVVGPPGDEIDVDEHGRVKVQFPWDREGKCDSKSSCYIRVSQPWAGSGFGGMAVPRIGQEVVVEFIEGDPDRPLITGRVYNGTAKPPYALPANATRTVIKTNSSKGGGGFNELRFEDQKGKEQVFIHAERNRDLRVKKDNLEFIGENEHIMVKKDRFEKIDGDVHQKIGGEQNEQVGESVSLKVGQNLQQKAGMRIAQQAGTEIHLKAGMNVVIEAGMMITLKASGSFITIGPSGVSISGPIVLINSGGAAGSGAGCSPVAPQIAKEADKAVPGKVDKIQGGGRKKPKGPPSPTAIVMRQAAQSGTPFCEICEKAKKG